MSQVIWKYGIPVANRFTLLLPETAQVLTVEIQNEVPVIWVLLDPDEPKVERPFLLFDTEEPVQGIGRYIGTFPFTDGRGEFIFHLFEQEEI